MTSRRRKKGTSPMIWRKRRRSRGAASARAAAVGSRHASRASSTTRPARTTTTMRRRTASSRTVGLTIAKKSFVPPPRFFSADEAREINKGGRRNRDSGEYFEMVDNLMFKDGFLCKTASIKSISTRNIQPSFDELEKFRRPGDDMNEDVASLSTLFANRKKGHFMKGDVVIVIKGDLKNSRVALRK